MAHTESTTSSPVVWITGSGAPRLGQFLARDWASRGATIVLHAQRSLGTAEQTLRELQASGTAASLVAGDLSDLGTVQRLVGEIVAEWGRIDHLIHTAAIWEEQALEELTTEAVERTWRVNVQATLWCCQQVGLQMVRQPTGGSIVVIGDANVARPYRDHAAYLISKGALATLVDVMSYELSSRNQRVRVNGLLPGPMLLPGDRDVAQRPVQPTANRLGRPVTAGEVATAVRLLAENEALQAVLLPVQGGAA